jgi:glycosyltransferase involved in cell wall biosynthesis
MARPLTKDDFSAKITSFMKIAMIGQKGYPALSGGIEKHVQELSEQLVNKGHDIVVYSRGWYCKKTPVKTAVKRIFVPTIRTKNLDAIVHTFLSIIVAVAAWNKTEIFHIHGVGPALLAWLPKILRPSAKVVVTFHCVDREHKKWSKFARLMLWLGERAACRFSDSTITVSKTLTSYAKKNYQTDTVYIPNGVNVPKAENNPKLLKQLGLVPNQYFLMVSRLVEHKGQKTLIEAWKKAKEMHPELLANKKLAVVGGGAFTDSYVKELKELATDDDSVVLTGEQTGETLHSLFANAYAAIHPSTAEGLPIAVLEAMSYGKCVLASDIPEHLEITKDHGLSFAKNNIQELADGITMMAENPDLTKFVGKNAAEFVKANYNWDEIATNIDILYKNLAREQKENLALAWLTKRKPML